MSTNYPCQAYTNVKTKEMNRIEYHLTRVSSEKNFTR